MEKIFIFLLLSPSPSIFPFYHGHTQALVLAFPSSLSEDTSFPLSLLLLLELLTQT